MRSQARNDEDVARLHAVLNLARDVHAFPGENDGEFQELMPVLRHGMLVRGPEDDHA